jgi:hypothetical protein
MVEAGDQRGPRAGEVARTAPHLGEERPGTGAEVGQHPLAVEGGIEDVERGEGEARQLLGGVGSFPALLARGAQQQVAQDEAAEAGAVAHQEEAARRRMAEQLGEQVRRLPALATHRFDAGLEGAQHAVDGGPVVGRRRPPGEDAAAAGDRLAPRAQRQQVEDGAAGRAGARVAEDAPPLPQQVAHESAEGLGPGKVVPHRVVAAPVGGVVVERCPGLGGVLS